MPESVYLVVGGDSGIGAALCEALRDRSADFYATTRRPSAQSARRLPLDLAALERFPRTLDAIDGLTRSRRLVAFIMAGISGYEACDREPTQSRRVNVYGAGALSQRLLKQAATVVFPSTSAVFDRHSPKRENSPTCPTTEYGRQKAETEAFLLEECERSSESRPIVARLTKVLSGSAGRVARWVLDLRRGCEIEAAEDVSLCPISMGFAVSALLQLAARDESGVFHIAGSRTLTYYDFAVALSGEIPARASLVRKTTSLATIPRGVANAAIDLDTTFTAARADVGPQALVSVIRELTDAGAARAEG